MVSIYLEDFGRENLPMILAKKVEIKEQKLLVERLEKRSKSRPSQDRVQGWYGGESA